MDREGFVSPKEMPMVIIACQVLQDLLEPLIPEDLTDSLSFKEYGLHRVPDKMTQTLQQTIDDIEEPSLVVLGYGLCGNGLDGVHARKHTLLIPRVDDCIALLLGSREAYLEQFDAVPGTYYLSRGWLESGSHPLSEYEEYAEKYGSTDAQWILDQQYQHYERLALVAHSEADLEACRPASQPVAQYCRRWDMRYEEILGSDGYVRRLIETAMLLCDGRPAIEARVSQDFLIVSPGGRVASDAFVPDVAWES